MRVLDDNTITSTVIHSARHRPIVIGSLIILIHTVLLLVVLPIVGAHLGRSYNQERFADGYDYLATNLAAGHGYRFYPDTAKTLMREPGYPVVLAGLFWAFGKKFIPVELVNLLLTLATAWLMTRIVRKLTAHRWPILAAALLFLFNPGTLIAESRGGVESLFGFLIVLFLLTVYKAIESERVTAYLVSGLVLGLALLVRSVPILFPVFLLLYLLIFERRMIPPIAAFRNIAVMIVAMLAALSPWIIRNYSLTGKFVPTASVFGMSAHAGQYICTHRFTGKPWWLLDREAAHERSRLAMQLGYPFFDGFNPSSLGKTDGYYQIFYRTGDEMKFSSFLVKRVLNKYKQSPGMCAKCMGDNLLNFWFEGKTRAVTIANVILQIPYLLLAGAGIIIGLKNRQAKIVAPMILFMAYVIAVYVPILAQARYSVPLIPFLSILGTITLIEVQKRLANKDRMDAGSRIS